MVSYLDGGMPLTAPNLLSSNAVERSGSAGCCLAIQRRRRSELLRAYFIFIGSGERVIQPTPQHINPAAVRASLRLNSLRPHPLQETLTCAPPVPSAGADRCVRRSRGEAADGSASAHRLVLQYTPQVARLSRSSRRWRLVGRYEPRVRSAVGMPRLGPLAARSAARLPLPPPPLRPRTQWPLPERLRSRQGASSSVSARPCDRARPAGHPGRGAWLGRPREHRMCDVVARWDRPRDGTLGGGQ